MVRFLCPVNYFVFEDARFSYNFVLQTNIIFTAQSRLKWKLPSSKLTLLIVILISCVHPIFILHRWWRPWMMLMMHRWFHHTLLFYVRIIRRKLVIIGILLFMVCHLGHLFLFVSVLWNHSGLFQVFLRFDGFLEMFCMSGKGVATAGRLSSRCIRQSFWYPFQISWITFLYLKFKKY